MKEKRGKDTEQGGDGEKIGTCEENEGKKGLNCKQEDL